MTQATKLPQVFPWTGRLDLAEVKRLIERAQADPAFKDELIRDPRSAMSTLGLAWDAELVRPLFDPQATGPVSSEVQAYRNYIRAKLVYRDHIRQAAAGLHPRYRVWRQRQIGRTVLELGPARADCIVHAPMCIELNKGCSVGCWFCGVAAPKLSDIWPYEENREYWRAFLHTMKELLGPAAAHGFCYWATDPLDNPDYERFCLDFADILGLFPQTTTALALRDPDRVRALLQLSEQHGCKVNRFSLLTLGQFHKAQQAYSPRELLNVECIPQNKESLLKRSRAGRATNHERRATEVVEQPGTIACVSGFLFNMLERSVKLITPCGANETWPLGYWVVAEATFQEMEDLSTTLEAMLERLPVSVFEIGPLRLSRILQWRATEDGLELFNSEASLRFKDPARRAALVEIARLLGEGGHNAEEIATICRFTQGRHRDFTMDVLERLFQAGALDEDPAPFQRETPAQAEPEMAGKAAP